MKNISFFIFCILFLSSFTNHDKKLFKFSSKLWKTKNIQLKTLDNIITDVSYIQQISIKDSIVGYACFANSYGCKIGGCNAPSEQLKNSSIYETFEYLVIYDTKIKILKIDIINYGGEYGYEICSSNWLKQFRGNSYNYKLNENIDAISGATVSATHLVHNLNQLGIKMQRNFARKPK